MVLSSRTSTPAHQLILYSLAKVTSSLKNSWRSLYPVKIRRHQTATQQQPTYTSQYQTLTLSEVIERLELERLSPWLLTSSNFAHLLK